MGSDVMYEVRLQKLFQNRKSIKPRAKESKTLVPEEFSVSQYSFVKNKSQDVV